MAEIDPAEQEGPPDWQRNVQPGDDPGDHFVEALEAWGYAGFRLFEARSARGLSKREAAARAGFSEALWRHLEAGSKKVDGYSVLPNPKDETLEAAALAVGLDPRELFTAVGRIYRKATPAAQVSVEDIASKLRGLAPRDLVLVSRLVDGMLGLD